MRCRVGHKAQRQAGGAHPHHGLTRARDRLVIDVKHAVQVDQERFDGGERSGHAPTMPHPDRASV